MVIDIVVYFYWTINIRVNVHYDILIITESKQSLLSVVNKVYFQYSEARQEKRFLCAQNYPGWQHSHNVMSFPSRGGAHGVMSFPSRGRAHGFVYFQYSNAFSIVSFIQN